jgi:broad specificity phosphatase PhoE
MRRTLELTMARAYRNTYFALRHGKSLANAEGIIVSLPENGVEGYGLSPEGAVDARAKLRPERVRAAGFGARPVVVFTSDFKRARETAAIFCELNGLPPATVDVRLRERVFGALEKKVAKDNYDTIWACDRAEEVHGRHGCESTRAVRDRMLSVVEECEARFEGRDVVLVSHGDPLQILETAFAGLRSNQHRDVPHLDTAELRRLGRD